MIANAAFINEAVGFELVFGRGPKFDVHATPLWLKAIDNMEINYGAADEAVKTACTEMYVWNVDGRQITFDYAFGEWSVSVK